MFWTLGLLLCLGFGVGAAYLYKFKVSDPKKNYIPPPSFALIDQALPEEIMHMIMLESDLNSLLNISEVSKYWNYLSKQDFIRYTVFKREGGYRPTKAEFEADQLRVGQNNPDFIPYESMQWLPYDRETYRHEWVVEDLQLSKRLNKKIIDAPMSSLHDFERSIGYIPNGLTRAAYERMAKYLVKLRLTAVAITVLGNWKFREGDNKDLLKLVSKAKVNPKWQLIRESTVEIIGDMLEIYPGSTWIQTIHRYRVIDNRKLIADIMPIDYWIWFLVFLLFMPCILLDLRTLPSGFQYVVYYGCAIITIITIYGFTGGVLWQGKQKEQIQGFIFFLVIFATILTFGIIFTPWIITLRIGFFIACLHLTSLYLRNTRIYITQSFHRHALAILGYSGIMALFVIDWKLLADSLKNGTTFWAILFNCFKYGGLSVLLICLNFARNTIIQRANRTWTLKTAMKLDHELLTYIKISAVGAALLTLCVPTLDTLL